MGFRMELRIEVRRDFIVPTRVTIISKVRKFRPKDFLESKIVEIRKSVCPFCPGNEHMTPPATLIAKIEGNEVKYYRDEGDTRVKGWFVRIFPNKYPALITSLPPPTYGYHEVIVETPNHDQEAYFLPVEKYALVLRAVFKRIADIIKDPNINHVILIKNYGSRSGASLEHPHMQLFATSFTLPYIMEEIEYCTKHYKSTNICPYCKLISEEKKSPRLIYENEKFIAISARAPRTPYESWILPKFHEDKPLSLDDDSLINLADVLSKVLRAIHGYLNNPSYNIWLHMAPKLSNELIYHWHIEIAPVLVTWGGFERGSGVYIVPVSPEEAAQELRTYILSNLK